MRALRESILDNMDKQIHRAEQFADLALSLERIKEAMYAKSTGDIKQEFINAGFFPNATLLRWIENEVGRVDTSVERLRGKVQVDLSVYGADETDEPDDFVSYIDMYVMYDMDDNSVSISIADVQSAGSKAAVGDKFSSFLRTDFFTKLSKLMNKYHAKCSDKKYSYKHLRRNIEYTIQL